MIIMITCTCTCPDRYPLGWTQGDIKVDVSVGLARQLQLALGIDQYYKLHGRVSRTIDRAEQLQIKEAVDQRAAAAACNAEWPLGFAVFTKVDHVAERGSN